MPTFFTITLDTTAPAGALLVVNGGMPIAQAQTVTIELTTTDADPTGYQAKLWGDVDPDASPNYEPLEADAPWVAYGSLATLDVADGDGLKTIHARIRDDVGNETAVLTATVTLDTTGPVLDITVGPDRTRVSKVPGFNLASFTFVSDTDLQGWEVRIVGSGAADHTQGTAIISSAVAVAANQPVPITTSGQDLDDYSPGDGDKIVKVFGQDTYGRWSA